MTLDDVDSARSRNMRAIRSSNTGPELLLRHELHRRGFRYRIAPRTVAGRPDLVLRRWNAVVLVHGCFWHAHANCRFFRLPNTREAFWRDKLASNAARDARTLERLMKEGWRVVVVWECALRADSQAVFTNVEGFLRSRFRFLELAGQ